jgi:hypothetical protein
MEGGMIATFLFVAVTARIGRKAVVGKRVN